MTPLALLHGDLRTAVIVGVAIVVLVCIERVHRYLDRPVEWRLDENDMPIISTLWTDRRGGPR